MANPEHLELLRQGVDGWNTWRRAEEPSVQPDLEGADLSDANLLGANLKGADLSGTNLRDANLTDANLRQANLAEANLARALLVRADLSEANLVEAYLSDVDLREANLSGANLDGADLARASLIKADLTWTNLFEARLSGANLSNACLADAQLCWANLGNALFVGADLRGANLHGAILIESDLSNADLTGCLIYGISAWNVKLTEGTKQQDLTITSLDEPTITVDDLEVAQFIHLLLQNQKLQRVIDTITSKVVLILGRFSIPERKQVLDALRDELRKAERGYVPVVFDFEKPTSRTTDETITLLARMARFVIADLSDAKSVLHELRGIVPVNPTLPVQPIIVKGQEEPGMFDFFERYPWFLKAHRYDSTAQLLAHLDKRVIAPPEAKVTKLRASAKSASTRQRPSRR
jgi:uncharacterized protein YjbI with pentapeptide repeats